MKKENCILLKKKIEIILFLISTKANELFIYNYFHNLYLKIFLIKIFFYVKKLINKFI